MKYRKTTIIAENEMLITLLYVIIVCEWFSNGKDYQNQVRKQNTRAQAPFHIASKIL